MSDTAESVEYAQRATMLYCDLGEVRDIQAMQGPKGVSRIEYAISTVTEQLKPIPVPSVIQGLRPAGEP